MTNVSLKLCNFKNIHDEFLDEFIGQRDGLVPFPGLKYFSQLPAEDKHKQLCIKELKKAFTCKFKCYAERKKDQIQADKFIDHIDIEYWKNWYFIIKKYANLGKILSEFLDDFELLKKDSKTYEFKYRSICLIWYNKDQSAVKDLRV